MKLKIVVGMLCAVLALSGCASVGRTAKADFHGLIVNESGVPVSGYEIEIDGKKSAITNNNGFFLIESCNAENMIFTARKPEWDTINAAESVVDSTKLYVYQAKSHRAVLAEIEDEILGGHYQSALQTICGLEDEWDDDSKLKFFRSVICYRQGYFLDALNCLDESGIDCSSNTYVSKYRMILVSKAGGHNE